METLNWVDIVGKFLLYLLGGIVSGVFILFGWSLKETFKNSKDLNALHSSKRSCEGRLDRIEKFLNGRFYDEQTHSNVENLLDRYNNGPSPTVSDDPDVDWR